ncbi:MAG: fibrillarin-like rRNA/tRNA 2'-O-methyltransferase [Candidatus Thermoplasmatota archaeon]|nr:fibrillarin-like rRNA/tRNA 2'-O-methyltransferase [Candidatus Thermoplasmatota archaeon]
MKSTEISGVFRQKGKLFTINPDKCKGIKIYNERLILYNGKEFRSWNPYRSKLAAAILNGLTSINFSSKKNILYLGAATGTTVSHISDITTEGTIYAVEYSPVAVKKLLEICKIRSNIVPILADANHPERYLSSVPKIDFIYQDISQRNQADIFIDNVKIFLKQKGEGILMIKARSIDVASSPKKIYDAVIDKIKKQDLNVTNLIDLSPNVKDHAAVVIAT